MNNNPKVLSLLHDAIESKDAAGVEEALTQAFRAGLTPDLIPLLMDVLSMNWHIRHEDVVLALQELKPPQAAQALREAALVTHEYLDYDAFFGLARKCTWALADIGTPKAKDALFELAETDNEIIAGYAQKRLDRWEQELDRKGA
ncbi:MAG: hypothetical protein GY794_18185 [bacterium]|nr:hypothetical protein [bacterium]